MSRDKKQWMEYLKTENDYLTFVLEAFQVPETAENDSDGEYLLDVSSKKIRVMSKGKRAPAETVEELEEQTELVKKKFEQRKATKNTNALTKADRKRIKLEKLQKVQKMQNLKRVMSNETAKQDPEEKKKKIKNEAGSSAAASKKVFNKEGKLFFSKVEMEGVNGKKKKKGHDTNPQSNLQKLKSQKKKIRELIESGDKSTAKDEKQKILWQSAFDKTEGVKVKDNEEILKKTIKKRKIIKKKSKEQWQDRKKKIEEKQSTKLKKREENLTKRKTDKQKTKMKRAVKKGRVF